MNNLQANARALKKVNGNTSDRKGLVSALKSTPFDAPRGPVRIDPNTNSPVQNVYVRQVKGGREIVVGVAQKDAEDPAFGCQMAT